VGVEPVSAGIRLATGTVLLFLAGLGSAAATTRPVLAQPDPGPRLVARCASGQARSHAPVPILMYHVIAEAPATAPYPNLFVSPARFRAQVRILARHGYRGVTLDQVWAHWRHCKPLPRKAVVVSFDDGFGSWHRVAYPVLRRRGWLGTMDLALSHLNGIDVRKRWMRKLIRAGWELDSHTLTHPDLTTLGDDALRREVAGSRRRLRRIFDVPVHFFCYPSGRFDERVIAAVRAAGYRGATTTIEGLARPAERFVMKRVRVNGDDTPADVLANMGG
jgi:peptidoglycan/xylan/chitin deacetylase (PgdA/CDA1 family)